MIKWVSVWKLKKSINIIDHISRLKREIRITSIDAGNVSDKIQYPVMIKNPSKLVTKRDFLNSQKHTANVILK